MFPDLSTLPKGFTLNMAHYVKRASKVTNGYIVNGDSHLKVRVDSDYGLGFFFGSFLSLGVVSLSSYRGQVFLRFKDDTESTTLYNSIEDSFNIAPRYRSLSDGRYEMVVYSKPIARLMGEFGSGENRSLPSKYLVNNSGYLSGIVTSLHQYKGFSEDRREILNPRKYSYRLEKLYLFLLESKISI